MSLIRCQECEKEVSSLSDHCVHCGFPVLSINRQLEEFRHSRIQLLAETVMEHGLEDAKVVVHLVPRESILIEKNYGIVGISAYISKSIHLLYGGSIEPQFDGNGIVLLQNSYDTHKPLARMEIHRNGIVEAVDTLFFGVNKNVGYFLIDLFMDRIVVSVNELLMVYKLVGVRPPFTLMVSLMGIKNYTVSSKTVHFPGKRATRDVVFMQKIELTNTEPVERTELRQFFEQLWNSFGYMRVRNMGKQAAVSAYAKDDVHKK
jgi:hypothetical protein